MANVGKRVHKHLENRVHMECPMKQRQSIQLVVRVLSMVRLNHPGMLRAVVDLSCKVYFRELIYRLRPIDEYIPHGSTSACVSIVNDLEIDLHFDHCQAVNVSLQKIEINEKFKIEMK